MIEEDIPFESFKNEAFYTSINNRIGFEEQSRISLKKKKFKLSKKKIKKVHSEKDAYTSYTFYISEEKAIDDSVLENLMIVKRENKVEVYHFKYSNAPKGVIPHNYDLKNNLSFEKIYDFDFKNSTTKKELDLIDAPGSGGEETGGGSYCYTVEVLISYSCYGAGASQTHYQDSDCDCDDSYGSCSSPHTEYNSDTFCSS